MDNGRGRQPGRLGGMHPRILLMYPPQQFRLEDSAKPDWSLSLPYLAAGLRSHGYEADILDGVVGNDHHSLDDTFRCHVKLPSGFFRNGMALRPLHAKSRGTTSSGSRRLCADFSCGRVDRARQASGPEEPRHSRWRERTMAARAVLRGRGESRMSFRSGALDCRNGGRAPQREPRLLRRIRHRVQG